MLFQLFQGFGVVAGDKFGDLEENSGLVWQKEVRVEEKNSVASDVDIVFGEGGVKRSTSEESSEGTMRFLAGREISKRGNIGR